MKKLLFIPFLLLSIAAYSQMNTFGGIGLRVNDTTTYQTNAAAYHTAGYYDIYFNNQATNDHFDVWNGSSYDHIFSFSSGGNFWKNAGTTNLTGNVDIQIPSQLTFQSIEGTIDIGNTPNGILIYGDQFKAGVSGDVAYMLMSGTASADILLTTADDINIGSGQSGSGHDVNITANYGHVHLTTGAAGILMDMGGPLTINTDAGTTGYVLQSNGSASPPTWVPAGGGGAPGGSTTQVQYNNAGAFGGISGATTNGTVMTLTSPVLVTPALGTPASGVGTNITGIVGTNVTNTPDGGIAATTAQAAINELDTEKANLASPTFTGTPAAPTASVGTNTTQVATTAFVNTTQGAWTDWSASLAPTGFTGTPTTVSYYIDNGKTVHIWISVSGTSNSAAFTFTLPVAPNAVYGAAGIRYTCFVINNSINASGRIVGSGSSTTITVDPSVTSSTWTSSGTKALYMEFTYQK